MMNPVDIIPGHTYTNIKNGNPYIVESIGLHSETLDMLVAYKNQEGETYFRPIGLFCLKFKKGAESGKGFTSLCESH
jgi:hypothetical protein